MTKRECLFLSVETGYLLCDLKELYLYIEELIGRPATTKELVDKKFWDRLKKLNKENLSEIKNLETTGTPLLTK